MKILYTSLRAKLEIVNIFFPNVKNIYFLNKCGAWNTYILVYVSSDAVQEKLKRKSSPITPTIDR